MKPPRRHVPSLDTNQEALERNRAYYEDAEASSPGQLDYWRKMAAPRARVARTLQVLRREAPSSVLDIGCGGGQLVQEIRKAFPAIRAAGCDLARDRIEANRRLMPDCEWFAGDVQQGDALAGIETPYDVVVALEVIEHLGDPEAFLTHVHAALKPSGLLFLSTQSGPLRETEKHVGHVRHFSTDDMSALLQRCGWEPRRVWNEGYPFHDLSKWYANLQPSKTLAQFSDKPYGFAQNTVCFALRQAFRINSRKRGAQLYALAQKPQA